MVDPLKIDLYGVGNISAGYVEYTSADTNSVFTSNMLALYQIIIKPIGSITASDYNAMAQAVNNLKALTDTTNQQDLVTTQMVGYMNDVFKSLQAAGIDVTNPNRSAILAGSDADHITKLKTWTDLGGFGIADVLKSASAGNYTRSLQSMIELDYVKTANEVIFNNLSSMEQAITNTQSVLATLTTIQNISNQLTVVTPAGKFTFPPVTTADIPNSLAIPPSTTRTVVPGATFPGNPPITLPSTVYITQKGQNTLNDTSALLSPNNSSRYSNFIKEYKRYASAYFSQVFPTSTASTGMATTLVNAKNSLMSQVLLLEKLNPSVTRSTTNSLAANIYQVALDISASFANTDPVTGLRNWIIDSQNLRASDPNFKNTGQIQDRITAAITAGENLNDTQKQQVQNYMFLFQQFYKSANDILSSIHQIIQKMAEQAGR